MGGCSAALLFMLFSEVDSFRVLLYAIVTVIGVLVGLEIPLLLRILKDRLEFKELVSQVFTFDYVGALLASLLFPLVLVPHLGLVRSSFLFGGLNVVWPWRRCNYCGGTWRGRVRCNRPGIGRSGGIDRGFCLFRPAAGMVGEGALTSIQ